MPTTVSFSFNTAANARKCYNYLRDRSILSSSYRRGRGDHLLRVDIPRGYTPEKIRANLSEAGFVFTYMGAD